MVVYVVAKGVCRQLVVGRILLHGCYGSIGVC